MNTETTTTDNTGAASSAEILDAVGARAVLRRRFERARTGRVRDAVKRVPWRAGDGKRVRTFNKDGMPVRGPGPGRTALRSFRRFLSQWKNAKHNGKPLPRP